MAGTTPRQMCAIAGSTFRSIVISRAGLAALGIAVIAVVLMPVLVSLKSLTILPGTAQILTLLTAPVAENPRPPWVLVPLLIVFYAGQIVWRERDAGLGEIVAAAPVPEWAIFMGKYLGLCLAIASSLALIAAALLLGQMRMGYFHLEIGLVTEILLGLQLADYLLFALLALVVHAVVNQKHLGHLLTLLAYAILANPSVVGLEHHLLIYGSSPQFLYSDIRGFGPTLGPWLWCKAYWAAWAVLLGVAGTLLWPRGLETGLSARLHQARRRLTRPLAATAAAALTLIAATGAFIFHNTNVRNQYRTESEELDRRAEYERRYGKFAGLPQPALTKTNLRVEIFPDRHQANIQGVHTLANTGPSPITEIHLTLAPDIDTSAVVFNRPATRQQTDDALRYSIYALLNPLQPGEAIELSFQIHYAPQGFRNHGAPSAIVANGSRIVNTEWLPAIGYQRDRELDAPVLRGRYKLGPRPPAPPARVGGERIGFEATIGTDAQQIALAPGTLRRTWNEGGRRYFHYVAGVPVNNRYHVYSAAYAKHEEQWNPPEGQSQPVSIQLLHHPTHGANRNRMVATVRAALDYYTRHFGPYPYSYVRLIEDPGPGVGVRTQAATIEFREGFALLNPGEGPQDVDAVFAVIAHAVARGWWGMQVGVADVDGAGLLDVGLETYSAMLVIEEKLGSAYLDRYVLSMREEFGTPRTRAAPPLLRANGNFARSRRAPIALYALSRYIGKENVNEALRNLLHKFGSGEPLATPTDLYRELEAVTPERYRPLLSDLFAKNTYWEFENERATARQTEAGSWEVTLEVQGRKTVVDEANIVTEIPMDDWIEVGVFGDGERYLQKHHIGPGKQTIKITVPQKPERAGIDPHHLLSDLGDIDSNTKAVQIGK